MDSTHLKFLIISNDNVIGTTEIYLIHQIMILVMRRIIDIIAFFISVIIYQCGRLADGDCSLCRNLAVTHSQLQCNWCDGQCKYNSFCQSREPEACPAPQVLSVSTNK